MLVLALCSSCSLGGLCNVQCFFVRLFLYIVFCRRNLLIALVLITCNNTTHFAIEYAATRTDRFVGLLIVMHNTARFVFDKDMDRAKAARYALTIRDSPEGCNRQDFAKYCCFSFSSHLGFL